VTYGILLLLLCLQATGLRAQRQVMFTHYMMNTPAINPAYAGSREAFTVTALNRSQWTQVFKRAPFTNSLNFHTPAERRDRIGMGMTLRNERLGPEQTTSVFGDFSYNINATRKSILAFGIKAGMEMYYANLTDLIIDDPADPMFAQDIQSFWLPNFGFGILFQTETFYAGFSIPKLLETNPFTNTIHAGAKPALLDRNYFVLSGAAIRLNVDIVFLPSTFIRFNRFGDFEMDLTTNFRIFNKFTLGAMFRPGDSVGFLTGIQITDLWTLGYAFDMGIYPKAASYHSGSHEIVLRYDFIFLNSHRERADRFF
jgi:type IX secretion system PorP/SprF family membrane protein